MTTAQLQEAAEPFVELITEVTLGAGREVALRLACMASRAETQPEGDVLTRFVVEVAIGALRRSRQLRTSRQEAAELLLHFARRLQHALAGRLGAEHGEGLFKRHEAALERAVQGELMQLVASPAVQRALSAQLSPALSYTSMLSGGMHHQGETVSALGLVLLISLAQLLLLVPFALVPQLERPLREDREDGDGEPLLWIFDAGVKLALYEASSAFVLVACVLLPVVPCGLRAEADAEDAAVFDGGQAGEARVLVLAILALAVVVAQMAEELRALWSLGVRRHPLHALGAYLGDTFNVLDVLGLCLACVALTVHVNAGLGGGLGGDVGECTALWLSQLTSLAVLPLGLRLMRVFYLSGQLGPFLQMVLRMVRDVADFVFMAVPILVAFACAFHVLFKGLPPALGSDECGALEDTLRGPGGGILLPMVLLAELILGGADARLECLRLSESPSARVAWVLMLLWGFAATVLLLNVLIAAMAKVRVCCFLRASEHCECAPARRGSARAAAHSGRRTTPVTRTASQSPRYVTAMRSHSTWCSRLAASTRSTSRPSSSSLPGSCRSCRRH